MSARFKDRGRPNTWCRPRRRFRRFLVLIAALTVGGTIYAWTQQSAIPQAAFDVAAACRRVPLINADTGETLAGQAEDLAIDQGRDRLFLSIYDRRAAEAGDAPDGGVFIAPVARVAGADAELRVSRAALGDFEVDAPHGIAFQNDRLAVVARQYHDGALSDATIRVYAADARAFRTSAILRNPFFIRANDLEWSKTGDLYVTFDRASGGFWPTLWRQATAARTGSVMRFDLESGRSATVADGLHFANGVVAAGKTVYVAETRGRAVRAYPEAILEESPLPVQTFGEIRLPGAPDNLTADDDGRVLAALHNNLPVYAWARHGPGRRSGSRIVEMSGSTARILLDDREGDLLNGATSAVALGGGDVAVGSATAPGLAICRLRS